MSTLADAAAAALLRLGPPSRAHEDWRYVDCRALEHLPQRRASAAALAGQAALPAGVHALLRQMLAETPDPTPGFACVGAAAVMSVAAGRAEIAAGDGVVCIDVLRGCTAELDLDRGGCQWLVLRLGPGATLRVREHQRSIDSAPALFAVDADLDRDARLIWTAQAIRSSASADGLARARLAVRLRAQGAALDYASADALSAGQAHRLTRVEHAAPHTQSRQLLKTVLRGTAQSSCDGLIHVRKGADGTDADFQNRNLVLSEHARADTRPQLDIRADDVKAAHGATVGQLDGEELLYLRCRGVPLAAAQQALTAGFLDEIAGHGAAR